MTYTYPTKTTLFSATWTLIYDILVANLTDPKSRSSNARWIFSSFPDIDDYNATSPTSTEWCYPIIIIDSPNLGKTPMSVDQDNPIVDNKLTINITVFSLSAEQVESIAEEITNDIDTNRKEFSNINLDSTSNDWPIISDNKVHSKTLVFSERLVFK